MKQPARAAGSRDRESIPRKTPATAVVTAAAQAASARLVIDPIGYVRSSFLAKVEAGRQPAAVRGAAARIELLPGRHFEHALEDLIGWERLWVIFWFHHNNGWRPKVLPPRSTTGRKGVFATRAPHRPNPIGLSAVRLVGIEGLTVHIEDADMLDGTPVLDIKPYVAYTDSHPGAASGWLAAATTDGAPPPDPQPAWRVALEPLAQEQVAWIGEHDTLDLAGRIVSTLTLGPEPHPYRRIRRLPEGMLLAVKDWRVKFSVRGREARVLRIDSGYRTAQLAGGADPALEVHRAFVARWPRSGRPSPAPDER
ncbi:MAG: tRNA (N6-threonylcarbamoyladenosine(37)-N6)-methyltransferase TrmO [Proteobacteria bacterium]|nr:tRNA (N6-threonylcarbamoyladenosine(37)-N6)-methyltransferase TrmO [Pseudomonadota bacterium]